MVGSEPETGGFQYALRAETRGGDTSVGGVHSKKVPSAPGGGFGADGLEMSV